MIGVAEETLEHPNQSSCKYPSQRVLPSIPHFPDRKVRDFTPVRPYDRQVFLVGDRRPFNTILIYPDYDFRKTIAIV